MKTYSQLFEDAASGRETFATIRACVNAIAERGGARGLVIEAGAVFDRPPHLSRRKMIEWMIAQANENLASWQRTRPGFGF